VIVGPHCDPGFEIDGTEDSASWSFEGMSEFRLCLTRTGANQGYPPSWATGDGGLRRLPAGPGNAMGYDDLNVIEAASSGRSTRWTRRWASR
jgi:hypothetical protein